MFIKLKSVKVTVPVLYRIACIQKQPPKVFYRNRCPKKFHKIHDKTHVPVSLLIKLQACNVKNNFFTEHLRATASMYYYNF